jgi:hypothetical protein
MKQCKKCKQFKPENQFEKTKKTKSGIGANCQDCHKEYMREKARKYYEENPEKFKKRNKSWWKDNPIKTKEIHEKSRIKLKREVFEILGGSKCSCCGEKEFDFLSIDHKNNNGSKERKEKRLKGGANFYVYVKNQKNPTEYYQVLCFNCNLAKGFYGKCPHNKKIK